MLHEAIHFTLIMINIANQLYNLYFIYHRMLENRGPHMVENDYTPLSALDIFVKDLVRLTFLLLGSVQFGKS